MPVKTKQELIEEKIIDFNTHYCNVHPGDSGTGGNDPQEPVDEFACYPSDIRKFIRQIMDESYVLGKENMKTAFRITVDAVKKVR